MFRYQKFLWAISAVFTAIGVPVGAEAQNASQTAAEQSAASGLGEITVTAQRREESVQDVPVSIQAFSGDDIQIRGIERVENVVQSSPNVVISSGPSGQVSPSFIMRGIPGAGFFVDGVWQQSTLGLGQRGVTEVDRVEVLRGPQGTLFGRDSTGGAIRLWTRKPADEFGVRTKVTVGSYNRRDIIVNADLPVTDTLKSKFSFSNEQRDGYVKSLITSRATGEIDDQFVRADFLWEPVDKFTLRLSGDKTRSRSTQPNVTLHIFDPGPVGPSPGLGFTVPPHQYYEVLGIPYNCQSNVMNCPGGVVGDLETVDGYNSGPGVKIDMQSYSLKMDYNLTDKMSLTSLTNYQKQTSWFYSDFDASSLDFFQQGTNAQRGTWSSEMQFAGDISRFHWVGGYYWWQDDNKTHGARWALWDFAPGGKIGAPFTFAQLAANPLCQPVVPPNAPCARLGLISSDTMNWTRQEGHAWFGEFTMDITKSLSATVGVRSHTQQNDTLTPVFAPETARRGQITGTFTSGDLFADAGKINPRVLEFSKTTYRFALSNKFSDTKMAYLSYSEGYNAGGISRINIPDVNGVLIATDFPFTPETIKNYEIGFRSDWLDNKLRVNVTYFRTYWNDIQLSGTVRNPLTGEVLPTFLTQNAAEALAKGGEVGLVYRPIPQLLFNVDAGFLDTGYKTIAAAIGQDLTLTSRFGGAPANQFSYGAQWNQSLSKGDLQIRADYNYTTGYQRTYVPGDQSTTYSGERWEVPGHGLLQAKVVYTPPSGMYDVQFFGTNLLDERYSTGGFMSPLLQIDDGTVGRPREYGVQLNVYFK